MKVTISTVQEVGLAIRALRKQAGIRIDDFATTARVSKQFISDLENGKPTVQMGRVLTLLADLGVYLTLDLPDITETSLSKERIRAARKLPSAANQ